jgi:hypothetical protein
MSNPYDRNGHHAADNAMSTYCTSCGRMSSCWNIACDHESVREDVHDEHGYLVRKGSR